MHDPLPEQLELGRLIEALGAHARVERLARVEDDGRAHPIVGVTLGSDDPRAPAILFVGGVHGLERIGTQVVLAHLHQLAERLVWDRTARQMLEHARVAFLPIVNPGGMRRRTRANPNDVDLMRNGPPHPEAHPAPLVGGQRVSRALPWYAGAPEGLCQVESRALVRFVEATLFSSPAALSIDCHSGYGMVDRLWFPYARTRRPIANLAEARMLERLLDRTLPNHVYRLEPTAQSYTIDGDLWDHLYDGYREANPEGLFLPLTLEMGSWLWVRKNPRQLFDPLGSFNPMIVHRHRRTLRRHLPLFDFLERLTASADALRAGSGAERLELEREGYARWYGR
jgi:hypothetical protein